MFKFEIRDYFQNSKENDKEYILNKVNPEIVRGLSAFSALHEEVYNLRSGETEVVANLKNRFSVDELKQDVFTILSEFEIFEKLRNKKYLKDFAKSYFDSESSNYDNKDRATINIKKSRIKSSLDKYNSTNKVKHIFAKDLFANLDSFLNCVIDHEDDLGDYLNTEYLRVFNSLVTKGLTVGNYYERVINKKLDVDIPALGINHIPESAEYNLDEKKFTKLQKVIRPHLQVVVNKVGKSKDPEVVKNLIKVFFRDDFSGQFLRHELKISDIINDSNNNLLAKELFTYLQEGDDDQKEYAARELLRLELGKINISKDGLEYLNKRIDLGQDNRDDYFAQRLTNQGDIGIFDKDKALQKFINISQDLAVNETNISKVTQEIFYDTLFVGKANESKEEHEKRLGYLEEFKKNYYEIAQNDIFTKTRVRLNNLSFKEQGWFVIFFNEADANKKEQLKELVTTYGEDGIKTFLAMETDEKNGNKIIKIGEVLDKPVAQAVFMKYNEVAALIKQKSEELSQQFFNNDKKVEPATQILQRASQLLIEYEAKIDKLDYQNMSELERLNVNKELLQNLTKVKRDAIFFTSMFKTAFEQDGSLKFEDVRGLDFKIATSADMSTEEIDDHKKLAEIRYQDNSEELKAVKLDIDEAILKGKDSKWYDLRKQGVLIATIRFDKQSDNTMYAGSLMVHPGFEGSAISKALQSESVDVEAKNNKLVAVVTPGKQVSSYYLEKQDWAIDGLVNDYKTNNPLFTMIRDDEKLQFLNTKKADYSIDKIRLDWQSQAANNIEGEQDFDKQIFYLKNKLDESDLNNLNRFLKNDFIMTRMVKDPDNQDYSFYVLEKKPLVKEAKLAA